MDVFRMSTRKIPEEHRHRPAPQRKSTKNALPEFTKVTAASELLDSNFKAKHWSYFEALSLEKLPSKNSLWSQWRWYGMKSGIGQVEMAWRVEFAWRVAFSKVCRRCTLSSEDYLQWWSYIQIPQLTITFALTVNLKILILCRNIILIYQKLKYSVAYPQRNLLDNCFFYSSLTSPTFLNLLRMWIRRCCSV